VTLGGLWRGLAALAGAGSLGAVALAVALSRPGPPVQAPVAITVEEGERFAESEENVFLLNGGAALRVPLQHARLIRFNGHVGRGADAEVVSNLVAPSQVSR